METVFVFPAGEPVETVAALDRHLPVQRDPWTVDGSLFITIEDEQAGYLFCDWDPDDVAALDAAIGYHPTWAVQVDISGRIDGTAEVRQLVALLLEHGGVAVDDYSAHPWTLQEIESAAVACDSSTITPTSSSSTASDTPHAPHRLGRWRQSPHDSVRLGDEHVGSAEDASR